jgi:hypothetical protein
MLVGWVTVGGKRSFNQEVLLKTLSALPPDHKLHKLWEHHVEEIATMHLEVEKIQKINELEALKTSLIKDKERQKKQQQFDDWVQDQKRTAHVIKVGPHKAHGRTWQSGA